MVQFVVDIEIGLTLEELTDLQKLSVKKGISVDAASRMAMMHGCKSLLLDELFEQVKKKMEYPEQAKTETPKEEVTPCAKYEVEIVKPEQALKEDIDS